jgi:2-keto-myo-inositol isomerase
MRLALNGATIMPSPLEDDVEISAACGYDALEIWAGKLPAYLAAHTLDDLRARMAELRIVPWCINSIEDITGRDGDGRRQLLAETRRLAEIARAIGAPSIVVVPGRTDVFDRRAAIGETIGVLRQMADVAADVSLAFEFLGKPGCAVPLLDMACEIVDGVGSAHVGLVIDTFHFYAGGSRLEDIAEVPVDRLLVVHVNGCEDLPKPALTDAHRLYPGEGAIPAVEILTALRERGFDGTASIEIFRPEYWAQDPRQVAATARAKALDVLARAGYGVRV